MLRYTDNKVIKSFQITGNNLTLYLKATSISLRLFLLQGNNFIRHGLYQNEYVKINLRI